MSLSQREQIAINVEDIYFSFPYQVGLIRMFYKYTYIMNSTIIGGHFDHLSGCTYRISEILENPTQIKNKAIINV